MKVPQSVSSAMAPQLTPPEMDDSPVGGDEADIPRAEDDTKGQESQGTPRCWPPAAARGVFEVSSCLLLGEARGVEAGLLAALGVTCVVTAAAELPPLPLGPPVEDSVRLALKDSPGDCIESLFDAVADKVDAVRAKGGRTLCSN
ncbi:dual specificity protein phosphatase 14-like isoform X2 [Hetaerina americana]|uniref:dual specificity protein phosphatase 14-like isoform X2 n=1 Tax=Hetaerina americana TaxID=62018 RepID=UPI003A7F3FE0